MSGGFQSEDSLGMGMCFLEFLQKKKKKQTAENGELDYVNIRILANV